MWVGFDKYTFYNYFKYYSILFKFLAYKVFAYIIYNNIGCYAVRYQVPLSTSNWARYIDRKTIVKPLSLYKSRKVFT